MHRCKEFKIMMEKLRNMVNKGRSLKTETPIGIPKADTIGSWRVVIFEKMLAEKCPEFLNDFHL